MMKKIVFAAFLAFCVGSPALADQQVSVCAPNVSHTGCAGEITPSGVSTGQESGHILKASPGVLEDLQITNWSTSAGVTVMLLDTTAIPSNGTIATCTGTPAQTSPCIMKWYGVGVAPSTSQPATVTASWQPGPWLHYLNGLVVVCSSTGPMTLTLTATCTFSGEVQ